MYRFSHAGWIAILAIPLALVMAACQPIQTPLSAAVSPTDPVEAKIANAVSAGPSMLAADAAVLDWPDATHPDFAELRAGSNGWACLPDDPSTPTDDPYCVDSQWMEFLNAFVAGRDPAYTSIGLGYMLQGGSTASNTDPMLMTPPDGQEWLVDGPHIMVVAPFDLSPDHHTTDPMGGLPYIMFEGTPLEHLMMPVELPEVQSADDRIANAMSGGPAALATNAAIWDWPTESNAEFTELRAGSNGWTCLPDDPSTPNANDPMCLDANWMEFFYAFFEGREPVYTDVGLGYMLQGGGAASVSDPFASEPAAGEEWMWDPPHVMVVAPYDLDPAVFATEPKDGQPYIMFEGTPYEHLMIPVVDMEHPD